MRISANKKAFLGITGLLWTVATTVAQAGPPGPGPTVAPRSPQFMLYFSRPIGGGVGAAATTHPTLGLKINQVRQMPNNGDPEARGEALQHRELINWQLGGRSPIRLADMRLQLGHRVTWDLSRGSFGKAAPRITLEPGSLRGAASTAPHTQLGTPRSTQSIERIGVSRAGERNMAALTSAALGPAQSMFLHHGPSHPQTPRNVWLQR